MEVTVKGIFKTGVLVTTLAMMSACSTMKEIEVRETKANPKWYMDEIEEDLDGLASTLKDLGAIVHRPKAYDLSKILSLILQCAKVNQIVQILI